MQPFATSLTHSLSTLVTAERLGALLRAAALLAAGIVLARLSGMALRRSLSGLSRQQQLIARRAVVYTVFGLFAISALRELGFRFEVLLGAAGILTVALGFASQTSASNLISGLFLILERPFEVGDVIKVSDVVGEVLTVDLLSTRLRTFDNLSVRIPNETMVKSQLTNYSRFPIRRVDLKIGVAYRSDLAEVQRVLLDVATRNPLCLEQPAPLLIAQGFGQSSVDYQLSVWATRDHWLDLRNALTREIKEAFDVHGIEIPYPHVSLYGGAAMDPIPLRWVGAPPGAPGGAPEDAPDGGTEGAATSPGAAPADAPAAEGGGAAERAAKGDANRRGSAT